MSEIIMYFTYETIHAQLTEELRNNSQYGLVCLGSRGRKVNQRVKVVAPVSGHTVQYNRKVTASFKSGWLNNIFPLSSWQGLENNHRVFVGQTDFENSCNNNFISIGFKFY